MTSRREIESLMNLPSKELYERVARDLKIVTTEIVKRRSEVEKQVKNTLDSIKDKICNDPRILAFTGRKLKHEEMVEIAIIIADIIAHHLGSPLPPSAIATLIVRKGLKWYCGYSH